MSQKDDKKSPVPVRLLDLEGFVEQGRKSAGVSRSAFIRRAIRAYQSGNGAAADPAPLIAQLEKLRQDLSRVGANLNQLAHGFNIDGPAAFDRDRLAKSHQELREEFAALVELLIQIRHEQRRIK